jgi:histidinol-phosphate aminotransferase
LDLQPENIICGVGSDEIISLLCQTFSGQGDEVIYTEHGFAMYKISALAAGATPVVVKEKKRTTDIKNIINKCNENTKLIFIANPNNPTGTMINLKQVEELAMKIPKQALLVLDGAYAEYVDNYDGGSQIVKNKSNVIMTRTFSKIYGLGGMRVGWGFGPKPVIEALQRVRGPFNLSVPALAVAEAAITDQDYIKRCKEENNATRDWFIASLRKLGLACDNSFTNFVLLRFKNKSQAELCDQYLQSKGVIVRRVDGYNLPEALRITVGDRNTCERLVGVIEEFLVRQE